MLEAGLPPVRDPARGHRARSTEKENRELRAAVLNHHHSPRARQEDRGRTQRDAEISRALSTDRGQRVIRRGVR